MSYASPTTNQNNVIKLYQDPVPYQIDTTFTNLVNAGDLLWFDSTNHWVASIDTEAHAAYFCGVALDGAYIQPYSTKFAAAEIPVGVKGIFRMKTIAGTYYDGLAVYQGTVAGGDPQTVTAVVGTNIIGTVVLPPGITSVVGGAGVYVQVKISPLFPVLQG